MVIIDPLGMSHVLPVLKLANFLDFGLFWIAKMAMYQVNKYVFITVKK